MSLLSNPPESGHTHAGAVLRIGTIPCLVSKLVRELQPHPAYLRLCPKDCDTVFAQKFSQGYPHEQPLLVTQENYIVGGYERWQQAKMAGREQVQCLEYIVAPEESVLLLIAYHRKSVHLNDFCRIRLALELEPWLRQQLHIRMKREGRRSTPSNLTNSEAIDVRAKLAHLAGVSAGNITKVRQLMQYADPSVLAAAQIGTISIHRAWCWSQLPPKEQKEQLQYLNGRPKLQRKIRELIARHKSSTVESSALHSIAAGVTQLRATIKPGPLCELFDDLLSALELLETSV